MLGSLGFFTTLTNFSFLIGIFTVVLAYHSVEISRFSIFGILEVQNLPFLTILEILNFDFYEFLHFLKVEIHQINKFQNS